jgi:16S rRNA processing protein RimM
MDLTEIVVGVITRAHGVRGEVVVDLRTDEPERRFADGQVLRPETGTGTGYTVVRTRQHQGRWLVTFEELTDRNAAEAARGVRLVAEVAADERPESDEEYYDRQLVGLSVLVARSPELVEGPIGTVTSVMHLPGHDMLEIRTADGQRLVPFVADLVPEVDLDRGTVTVADVTGLLTDEVEGDR